MSYIVFYEQYTLLLSTSTNPMKEIVQPPNNNLRRSQTERKNGQKKFEQSNRMSAGPAEFTLSELITPVRIYLVISTSSEHWNQSFPVYAQSQNTT